MKLSVRQTAARLGVSASLVYSILRQGRLSGVRIGCRGRGKWLVDEAEVDRFLAACKPAPPSLNHIH